MIAGYKYNSTLIAVACDGSFEASLLTCTCQIIETNNTYVMHGGNLDSHWMHLGCGKDLYLSAHSCALVFTIWSLFIPDCVLIFHAYTLAFPIYALFILNIWFFI